MKIGVIKLGARITWETEKGKVGPGEAVSICKALVQGGADVHIFTKITKKDMLDPSVTWHNILDDRDTSDCDVLAVINGNVNFFGGAEDRAQILNYELINNFKGHVAYVMCDPELPLMQIWPAVSKKNEGWGTDYKEADINITRKDITLIAQPNDLEHVAQHWNKKRGVQTKNILHFPFEKFPLLNQHLKAQKNPAIDLMYGGTARGGKRIPNIFKWYFGHPPELKVQIFGAIELDDFIKHREVGAGLLAGISAPEFAGPVFYNQVLPKMNSALAHLVTGDPAYEENNIIPQRTYECMAAGNLVFIDAKMDTCRRIYTSNDLREFMYVQTREDLSDRLRFLKQDGMAQQELLEMAQVDTNFNAGEYCKALVNVFTLKI